MAICKYIYIYAYTSTHPSTHTHKKYKHTQTFIYYEVLTLTVLQLYIATRQYFASVRNSDDFGSEEKVIIFNNAFEAGSW